MKKIERKRLSDRDQQATADALNEAPDHQFMEAVGLAAQPHRATEYQH